MKKNLFLRIAKLLVLCFFLLILANCGNGETEVVTVTGPGLVGLDDSTTQTAPLLIVTYNSPSVGAGTAQILSDLLSDGDVEFDSVTNTFTVTQGPQEDFFGVDSANPDQPEFRAFHTFVLDGSTGQQSIPSDAIINSATLEVFVDEVDFADTIPTFLDLIQYQFQNLSSADFDAPLVTSTSFRGFDFFSSDQNNFVDIDVTDLMGDAMTYTYPLFQDRFGLQSTALSPSRSSSLKTERHLGTKPRSLEKIRPRQNTGK